MGDAAFPRIVTLVLAGSLASIMHAAGHVLTWPPISGRLANAREARGMYVTAIDRTTWPANI